MSQTHFLSLAEVCVTSYCNLWLTKIVICLQRIYHFFLATYNLSIKVGDVKGSGTDGNVYIQLFGERGNTAKIQLRQAGDTRNKFEKGRTYKFTVDTVDIGKVIMPSPSPPLHWLVYWSQGGEVWVCNLDWSLLCVHGCNTLTLQCLSLPSLVQFVSRKLSGKPDETV